MKPTYSDGLPTGSKVMMTPKGSMTIKTFNKWLDHFTYMYISPSPLILVWAYEAYWDNELIKYWDKHPTRDLSRESFYTNMGKNKCRLQTLLAVSELRTFALTIKIFSRLRHLLLVCQLSSLTPQ
ncbi:ubiquitination factor e4 [Holotrichia oblita]|uniref:Ubiquitination factor e4 n=1 Tax=Holotrichia oblita TaxID=644536 RepID=A0ACB9TTL0_HOLOL|nr:ubiquitination factor e4 [Holotrichia oblita]